MGEERRTYHWGADQPANQRHVTVSAAAEALGISPEAVRMRIKRGTLPSEKHAGRVYVVLGSRPATEQTTEQTPDRTDALIAALETQIEDLREQVRSERQSHAESRRLLAAALERIPPQIEAPQETPSEAPGGPQAATEQPGRVAPQPSVEGVPEAPGAHESPTDEQQGRGPVPAHGGPQGPSERPWWQRIFGGGS